MEANQRAFAAANSSRFGVFRIYLHKDRGICLRPGSPSQNCLYFIAVFRERIFSESFCHPFHNFVIIFGKMRKKAVAAIFYPPFGDLVISAAIPDGVQWTIAKKAIEIIRVRIFMAWEIAAFAVAEKFEAILRHNFLSPIILRWIFRH